METLSIKECILINGGEPTTKTSLAYDLSYWITAGVKSIYNLF